MSNPLDAYNNAASKAIDSYNAAIDSGLKSSKLSADTQKAEAARTQEKSNAQAQQAYLQTINPYGYNQQSLAALGLARSGTSESSRISAGNAYSNALTAARESYDTTARQADLAYQQAQYAAAADKGKYAADTQQTIASTGLSYNEWAEEYALKKQELEDQIATNQITRQQAEEQLAVYRDFARKQAQADLEATQASTKATLASI